MAYEEYALDLSFQSTPAALTQFMVVLHDTTGFVKAPAAANDAKIAGVTMNAVTAASQTVLCRVLGVAKVVANGTVTNGDLLVVAGTAGDVATNNAPTAGFGKVGTALETAATTQVLAAFLQLGQA